MNGITVSIVTYHTPEDELQRCISSLDTPLVHCIYIVDNSRSEATKTQCERWHNVVYIPNDNTGYGSAHNIAMRRALEVGAEMHLVLNSDVRFEPEVIEKLADYMRRNPETGIVQPRITYPDGSLQYTCRLLPTPANVFVRRFMPHVAKRLDKKYLLKNYDHIKPLNVAYLQGSFMLVSAKALRRCGMFDERYFMYPEDIDLSRRVRRHFSVMYYPAVTVVHDHRAASYHSLRMLRIHAWNMIKYFNKWGWCNDKERKVLNKCVMRDINC